MTQIKDKNVLITGGASGIGKIMGRICLEKGAKNLIIWDVNPISLEQTRKELNTIGTVTTYSIDITDDQAVVKTYQQVLEQFGRIGVLINCAGIVRGNKTFNHNTIEDVRLTMNVNSIAPMVLSLQALQPMLDANEGHICNIASEAGMISNPKMTVYAASKWAVIGWSDSLRIELSEAKSNVHVTTIAPYYINTGMFDGVESPIFPILDPEKTAKKIIRAIEKNKDFCGLPWGFHFVRFMQGILPTKVFDFLFGTVFGIFKAMDHFTGRRPAADNKA